MCSCNTKRGVWFFPTPLEKSLYGQVSQINIIIHSKRQKALVFHPSMPDFNLTLPLMHVSNPDLTLQTVVYLVGHVNQATLLTTVIIYYPTSSLFELNRRHTTPNQWNHGLCGIGDVPRLMYPVFYWGMLKTIPSRLENDGLVDSISYSEYPCCLVL